MSEKPTNSQTGAIQPKPSTLMGALAARYPELATFTPGATLMEIKVVYGLGTLEQVRELGRRRSQRREAERTESPPRGQGRTLRAAPSRRRA